MSDPSWRDDAACATIGGDIWFPENNEPQTAAKQICNGCDVREQCLRYALDTGAEWGIWGGLNQSELRAIRAVDEVRA